MIAKLDAVDRLIADILKVGVEHIVTIQDQELTINRPVYARFTSKEMICQINALMLVLVVESER